MYFSFLKLSQFVPIRSSKSSVSLPHPGPEALTTWLFCQFAEDTDRHESCNPRRPFERASP
ncbi:hypothetical protein SCA6_002285 [Theobroma cacao]